MKKYVIFDMDGTLVDSMGFWRDLSREYLTKYNLDCPEYFTSKLLSMTLTQAGEFFKQELNLKDSPETIVADMNKIMAEHYATDIPLKDDIVEFLNKLKENGCKLAVATATALPLVNICLTRLGIIDYFDFCLSTETKNISKASPDIFLECCELFGSTPEETSIFEDALFALETSMKAGFDTNAIYDEPSNQFWESNKKMCNRYFMSWKDAIKNY